MLFFVMLSIYLQLSHLDKIKWTDICECSSHVALFHIKCSYFLTLVEAAMPKEYENRNNTYCFILIQQGSGHFTADKPSLASQHQVMWGIVRLIRVGTPQLQTCQINKAMSLVMFDSYKTMW